MSSVAALIEEALATVTEDGWSDGSEGEAAWRALRARADRETLDAAVALTRAPEARRRRLGAAILAQLGHTRPGFTPVFVEERFAALRRLLEDELAGACRSSVVADVCFAFGHLGDARGVQLAAAFATHASADVRYAVAHALATHDDHVGALIGLSRDDDVRVRDWATFGLGAMMQLDSPELRAALRAGLDDADADVRNEAISGLAARGDRVAVPAIIRELQIQFAVPLFEAAEALADPALAPALRAAKRLDWPSHVDAAWASALAACERSPKEE